MSTLILPQSIRQSNAADHERADTRLAQSAEDARELKAGIDRTVKWAHTDLAGYAAGDRIIAVRMPGVERVIHIKPDRAVASGMRLRVYPIRPARPCPGCGRLLYGIGEVQTATAPWHLKCWEVEQTMQEMAGALAIRFDDQGLPGVPPQSVDDMTHPWPPHKGRPRRRRR